MTVEKDGEKVEDLFDPMEINGETAKPATTKKPAADKKPAKAKAEPPATSDDEDRPNNPAGEELNSYLDRVERLLDEKKSIAGDIKDVKAEAKAKGYDMPTFNEMLRLRAMDKGEREERENLRDTYGHALGIFG